MSPRSCAECRYSGSPGVHWIEPDDPARQPYSVQCPAAAQDDQEKHAREVAILAHDDAWKAARAIMEDVAATMLEFDANIIRDRFNDARVPTSLRGNAFTWAHKKGLIEPVGERVMSSEKTTRHPVDRWRSLVHRARAS